MIAAIVGGVCVVMALMCSHIGTIFEASFALSGAPIGPIFATFIVGVFLPFVNASGALSGLLFGQFCCFFVNIGAMLNKYKKASLLYSTETCDEIVFQNTSVPFIPLANITDYKIPNHEPEGMNYMFHMTHFMIPVVGFLITFFTSIIVSLITRCNKDKKIKPELLSGIVVNFLKVKTEGDTKMEKNRMAIVH
ncbi:hypothetical protein B4U80_07248 [Leptotrombidium deliense]|uniref:Uncharacterized protein n=1 Tax=Leptotrombidium deliense TaxID=299467 RepID=A0A443RXG8_9ACAR|nr:hypothetical protein B4U80_07248 [Leptotrombidium deliense]